MIIADNLVRCFGSTVAVDSVSFSIGSGEIVGLLGHNGAGKSTVMRLLTGFLEPDAGSISIRDVQIAENPRQVQSMLGYLPENLPLYPDMTVIDYLEFTASIRNVPKTARSAAIRYAIAATDLGSHALHTISTLSRGYRQRVGVAQAILHRPNILILDEPTNGLDPDQTQAMRALIRDLAQTTTVILSTHIMQEVDALCDRVLILRNGRLAMDKEIAELHSSRRLHLGAKASRRQLKETLGHLGQVINGADQNTAWLECAKPIDTEIVAEVAKLLVQANIPVYALHPERRDLEQVFRQISAGQKLRT